MIGAVFLVAAYLLGVRVADGLAVRISGPLGMERPGWYLFGFGLPAILMVRYASIDSSLDRRWALAFIPIVITALFASYQIYVTAATLLGVVLYVTFSPGKFRFEALVAVVAAMVSIALLNSNPVLLERFTAEIARGLPWLDTSRYYNYWAGGLVTALDNPVIGVGPNNYDFYCAKIVGSFGEDYMGFSPSNPLDGCLNHPHQRYIQILAETGLVGFSLFVGMAVSLLKRAIRTVRCKSNSLAICAMGLALLIVNFWPISTFSEAFGQKLNFFYWFHIGWALVLLNLGSLSVGEKPKQSPSDSERT